MFLLRAYRLRPTIDKFFNDDTYGRDLPRLTPSDWQLIEYITRVGSVFLWLTNITSVGQVQLGSILAYFKYMRYCISKFQSNVHG
jgi:hypothetical protein